MAAFTEVCEESSAEHETIQDTGRLNVYRAQIVGISVLLALWLWAAFVRGRGYSHSLQLPILLATIVFIVLLNWFFPRLIQGNFAGFYESNKAFAFSLRAFLLPVVFFPEYFLGQPPLLTRSLVLLCLSLLLLIAYLVLSAAAPLKSFNLGLTSKAAVIIFCVIYFALTSSISLVKLRAFGYVGQDIGYFTQCLYTTLHGHLFYSNMYHDLLYGKSVSSDFSSHNQLVLGLFLFFYVFHKAASTLLIVRNVFIVLCAWPVYLISRRTLSPWLSAIAVVAFLLVPAILYQNFYDFAPLSVAGFPLLFALYFFLEGRFKPYVIALVLTQIVREDLVFVVFGLGLLALWQRRSLRWVAFPCAFAFCWAVLSWKVVFPYFQHGATSPVASCFSYLGTTSHQMVSNIISHPRLVLTRTNLVYTKQLLDPLGGVLFLLNPAWLLALPYIAINLLGQGGGCNTAMIYRHYSLIPAVLLFAGFLLSLEKIGKSPKRKRKELYLAQAAMVLFVLAAALSSILFVTGKQQLDDLQPQSWHAEARTIAAMLPADASVAVPRYLLPSMANRGSLYQSLRLLEYHNPDVEYIVLDKDWSRMAATDQWRENYLALWHWLEGNPQYAVVYDSPDYVIYKRCAGCVSILPHREPGQQDHE